MKINNCTKKRIKVRILTWLNNVAPGKRLAIPLEYGGTIYFDKMKMVDAIYKIKQTRL